MKTAEIRKKDGKWYVYEVWPVIGAEKILFGPFDKRNQAVEKYNELFK